MGDGKERSEWATLNANDATRLAIAVVAVCLAGFGVWLLRGRVNHTGRRGVAQWFLGYLAGEILFSLAAAFNWFPFWVRIWLSQAAAMLALAAVFVLLRAMADTEAATNGH